MARPTITFGMAVYRDYAGLWATLMALRMYQQFEGEIVVVDNDPGSEQGQLTRDFVNNWCGSGKNPARYIPYTEKTGTAAPRDRVFREAKSDIVCCLDSHVLLVPGAAVALARFFEKRPGSKDLVQGPMFYDDLKNHATHFTDNWGGEMWGQWAMARRGPDGRIVEPRQSHDGLTDLVSPVSYRKELYRDEKTGGAFRPSYSDHVAQMTAYGFNPAVDYDDTRWICPCGKTPVTPIRWSSGWPTTTTMRPPGPEWIRALKPAVASWGEAYSDLPCGCKLDIRISSSTVDIHPYLRGAGFEKINEVPFEIGAMGLGLFACRREAWLGFHEGFRAFGGEEWYIHGKYRKAGYKAWCLPALGWVHRFGRPGGVPYPLTSEDKIRNYVLGHLELGLSMDRLQHHFVNEMGFDPQRFREILAAEGVQPFDYVPSTTTGGPMNQRHDDLAEWAWKSGKWEQLSFPSGPNVGKYYECNPPKAAGEEEGETLLTRCKAKELQRNTAPPALPQEEKKGGCGCGAQPMTPEQQAEAKAKQARTMEQQYAHNPLPMLVEYATGAKKVIDFSDNRGPAFIAFMKAAPEELVSHARGTQEKLEGHKSESGGVTLRLSGKNALAADPESCDLLLLNEAAGADSLYEALVRHAPLCTGRIIIAGTNTREEAYEGGPGILPAVRRFLKENQNWTAKENLKEAPYKDGYLVLTCLVSDKKPLPSLWKQGWNAFKASWRVGESVIGKLGPLAGTEKQERRLALCTVCPSRNGEKCGECGCDLDLRTSWKEMNCPLGRWHDEATDDVT